MTIALYLSYSNVHKEFLYLSDTRLANNHLLIDTFRNINRSVEWHIHAAVYTVTRPTKVSKIQETQNNISVQYAYQTMMLYLWTSAQYTLLDNIFQLEEMTVNQA